MSTASDDVRKECAVCGSEFFVFPSRAATAKYCTPECSQKGSRGKARNYTPESRARLTGRPKTSKDIERTCPVCQTTFVLPEHNPKKYCSRTCAGKRPRNGLGRGTIEKTCTWCETAYYVYPSQSASRFCSHRCHRLYESANDKGRGELLPLSPENVAWLAGLLDGEGTILINNRRQRHNPSYTVQIANTSKPLIDRIVEVTGIKRIARGERKNPKHLPIYVWKVSGPPAVEFIQRLRPWLIVKADRADAMLAGLTFPRIALWDEIYPEEAAS